MKNIDRLSLYTTIYPGCEPFIEEWKQSVLTQRDTDFDVWVGVDGFSLDESKALLSGLPIKKIILNDKPEVKAHVRKKVFSEMLELYDGIVMVDSDDILKDSRIASARKDLSLYDVSGCAMDLVDSNTADLGFQFGRMRSGFSSDDIIFFNQFGLSNTAYRTDVLKQCLDIPEACELVDWFLITRAWLLGADIHFDSVARMSYRQYDKNSVKILPPFSAVDILKATRRVSRHFFYILEKTDIKENQMTRSLRARKKQIDQFENTTLNNKVLLEQYVNSLNKLSHDILWWACVANPNLEKIWTQ